jgi:hypothetical protein
MFEFGCQRSLAFAEKAARQGREAGEQSKSAIDSTPVHIPFWFIAGIKRRVTSLISGPASSA